jgi:putative ABC transport system permease protein
MDEVLASTLQGRRATVELTALFALLALALAAVGIYGVMAYGVAQRLHEIGVRVALGAQRRDILRLVVGQGMRTTAAGVLLGLVGTLALTRFLRGLLFAVEPTDPATLATVSGVLAGVALIACLVPARRATRVDPAVALRYE